MCYVNSLFVSDFDVYEATMPSMIYYHQASEGGRPYPLDTLTILCYDHIMCGGLPILTNLYLEP